MARPTTKFREELVGALPRLRRFGLVLAGSEADADDLLQATCERALSRWTQFSDGSRIDSWLFSIMHSIWKNTVRKKTTRRRAHGELARGTSFVDGDRVVSGKIAVTEVLSRLRQLDPDQAAALTLVALDGLSYREAADVLEIPQGTLESRIARGRIVLGRMLEAPVGAPAPAQARPAIAVTREVSPREVSQ